MQNTSHLTLSICGAGSSDEQRVRAYIPAPVGTRLLDQDEHGPRVEFPLTPTQLQAKNAHCHRCGESMGRGGYLALRECVCALRVTHTV